MSPVPAGNVSMPSCFKAYDIRGRVPEELDEALARRIGRAYAAQLRPRHVAVGRDVRLSSPAIAGALIEGLRARGADVYDLGLCGTELVYFATAQHGLDGGIMVTASHNPPDYNGMKLVRSGARPLSADTGLDAIKAEVSRTDAGAGPARGRLEALDVYDAYVRRLRGSVRSQTLKPLKIVADAGNGGAAAVVERLCAGLPFEVVGVRETPDGRFPHGVPNPLLPENRRMTSEAVRRAGADLGIAWDGDYDRCFFFDETGRFVEGYYVVGLLAEVVLKRHGGGRVVHDPRLTWNTREVVAANGGVAIQSKTGHAFMKERMRAADAAYGGEMSAHHYFRDFAYCDSGMIPWLLVAELLCERGAPLSALVAECQARYPVSGEINRHVPDPAMTIRTVEAAYAPAARRVEHVDGLSVEFPDWRFNLRGSNTEPLLRLNIEARDDPRLLRERTRELLALIDGAAAEAG
ncbi:MAG: phosphomannomutase [Gammaproteobacteria bacterium]|nr:phosphomannomutase [Gammaproteobacteria bacterium]